MIAPFLGGLEAVFGWLLEASWQASVLAVLVLGLQWLLREKLNPRWYHALWLLVIARLLLPALPESALSLFQFTPKAPLVITQTVTEPIFAAPSEVVPEMASVPMTAEPAGYPWSAFTVLALIWLAGASALAFVTWQVNRRFARHVAAARPVDDPRLLDLAATAHEELGIRRSVRMIESPRVHSPAIMGLFRPTLILPGEVGARFSDNELRFIFLHEFAHLKRGDLVLQFVIALLQILHWFNPVLWYAFRRARIDREPATDALVLSRAGESQKESYGGVLVKLLEHHQARYALPTLVGILEDKDQFKRRFSLIARFTRGAYGWSLLGIVLIGALAIACLTKGLHPHRPVDPTLPAVIDLSSSYTHSFRPDGSNSFFQGYAGRKTIDGLPFDINGKVQLFGKENTERGKDYPDEVSGIKIGHTFDELHLVHASEWREYEGCPVATVRLHYADGTHYDFTIRFDFQVNDWNRLLSEDEEIIADPDTKIIWRGPGAAEGTGRLFKSVLRNPFPEKRVDSMDLISTNSGCTYALVAATVAQSDPDREVTPPMPLLPPRHFDGALRVHVVDKKTGAALVGAEVYPAMTIGDIGLVADNLLTGDDGTAVVKYPKDGTRELRIKVTEAGYGDCEIHWNNGWQAGEIPEAITYRLAPNGTTGDDATPDFTVTPPPHPTLLAAVKLGDAAALQKLLDAGADLNQARDANGDPLLFAAGSPEVAEILLQHGADVNARDKRNEAVINSACRSGNGQSAAIVEVLIKHGADPNTHDGEVGETPLMDAEDGKTVDVLVAHGADLKATTTDGRPILMMAGDKKPDYLEALRRHGVSFNTGAGGSTVLVHAAWTNNLPAMNWLLAHGVDASAEGILAHEKNGRDDQMTPLEATVIWGQADAARLLLDHGAHSDRAEAIALQNHYENIVKLLWDHGDRHISELCYAISQHAPLEDLEKILQKDGAIDPPQDSIISPLGEAVETDNLPAVQWLVQHGADVNRGGNPVAGHTDFHDIPLVLAAQRGADDIVAFLLQHGARADANALYGAANGGIPSPFYVTRDHLPSREHYEKVTQMLLDAGAAKNVTPAWSGIVLSTAMSPCWGEPNPVVLQKLLAAGLSPKAPMPGQAERGDTPKSVIGYYRDYCRQYQDDPARSAQVAALKPLLDLLESADKSSHANADPSAPFASPAGPNANLITALQEGDATTKPGTDKNQAPMIRTATKIVQLDEDDYQAHRADIDNAVRNGDVAPLAALKSFNLISEPASLSRSGERAVLEAVRVFPYPDAFEKKADGSLEPTEFTKKDLGVRFVVSPTLSDGKINFTGDLSITSLAGWPPKEGPNPRPIFHVRELPVSESFASGQTKGFEVPGGAQMEPTDPDAVQSPQALRRVFLFLNAQALHADGTPMTGQFIDHAPAGVSPTTEIFTDRTFLAPVGFFKTTPGDYADVRPELIAHGIDFPAGTSATYLAFATADLTVAGKIVVRNAPEELDKIAGLFLSFGSGATWGTVHPESKPALDLDITQVEIEEKAYEADAKAMDAAVAEGNLSYFSGRKDVFVSPMTTVAYPLGRSWYSTGCVQSFIGSAAYDKWHGKTRTTLQAQAVFIGINAGFVLSSTDRNGISVDSTWSDSEPAADAATKFDPGTIPAQVPSTINLTPKMHLAQFIDKGWKIEPGKTHGFWLGPTLGQLSRTSQYTDRSHVSLEEMIKAKTPSRLAVFLTAKPLAADASSGADSPQSSTSAQPDALFQNVTVSGNLQLTPAGQVDLAKSVGYLQSVDGGSIDFHFQPDGSFAVPNVKPGVYNRRVHFVPTAPGAAAVDTTLAPLTVDGSAARMTANLNVAVQIAAPPKGSVQIGLKVLEISDDLYLAHKAKVDAAIEKADIGFFNNMEGVSLLSTPSVSTQPGKEATIDIVRKFPCPIKFDPAFRVPGLGGATVIVPTIPTDFVIKEVGVSAEITPTINAADSPDPGKIVLNGKFSVTDFDGFVESDVVGMQRGMPSFTTNESLFLEQLDDHQEKGLWIPGEHVAVQNPAAANSKPGWATTTPGVKKRYLLFVSASLVK